MSQGYIKLHRQLRECWIWVDDEPFDRRSAWVDILMSANHADNKMLFDGNLILIERGQFITSIRKLASKWKWSTTKVSHFLDVLESDQMITRKSDSKKTLISVVNYGNYQDSGTEKKTVKIQSNDTEVTLKNTNNNDKECIKNDKKNKYADDDELNRAILDFIDHRRKLRKPMTDKAVKLFIDRLNRLAESPRHQVTLINEAISRGWQTVYPVDGQSEQQALNKQKSKNRLKDLEKYYLQKVGDE